MGENKYFFNPFRQLSLMGTFMAAVFLCNVIWVDSGYTAQLQHQAAGTVQEEYHPDREDKTQEDMDRLGFLHDTPSSTSQQAIANVEPVAADMADINSEAPNPVGDGEEATLPPDNGSAISDDGAEADPVSRIANEIDTGIEARQNEIREMQAEADMVQGQLDLNKNERDNLDAEYEDLLDRDDELYQIISDIENRTPQSGDTQELLDELAQNLENAKMERDSLKARGDEIDARRAELETEASSLSKTLREIKDHIAVLEAELKKLQGD